VKKIKTPALIATILALLLVAGFVIPAVVRPQPTQTIVSSPTPTLAPAPVITSAKKVVISVEPVTGSLLSRYDSYDELVEYESGERRAFITTAPARDFKFIELYYNETEQRFYETVALYELSILRPERPFIAEATWSETIPNRGIRFVDEKGDTRFFWIGESGEDGRLFITEFEPVVPHSP